MTTLHTQRRKERAEGPTHLSVYRLMWMLVTFDLPVDTKKHRADATRFRQFLLDQGFERSQFSNYLRLVNGQENFDAHVRRIGGNLPERGDVFIFQFTDRQYENIVRFSDQSRRRRRKNPEQIALF